MKQYFPSNTYRIASRILWRFDTHSPCFVLVACTLCGYWLYKSRQIAPRRGVQLTPSRPAASGILRISNRGSTCTHLSYPAGKRVVNCNTHYSLSHRILLTGSKPFSVGFHSCPGRPLAWVELRLVLTRLLWAFEFIEEPAEPVDFDKFPVIMLIQKEAVKTRVKVRRGIKCETADNYVSLRRQCQYI